MARFMQPRKADTQSNVGNTPAGRQGGGTGGLIPEARGRARIFRSCRTYPSPRAPKSICWFLKKFGTPALRSASFQLASSFQLALRSSCRTSAAARGRWPGRSASSCRGRSRRWWRRGGTASRARWSTCDVKLKKAKLGAASLGNARRKKHAAFRCFAPLSGRLPPLSQGLEGAELIPCLVHPFRVNGWVNLPGPLGPPDPCFRPKARIAVKPLGFCRTPKYIQHAKGIRCIVA